MLPLDAVHVLDIRHHDLVGSDHHMEGGLTRVQVAPLPELTQDLTLVGITPIWHLEHKNYEDSTTATQKPPVGLRTGTPCEENCEYKEVLLYHTYLIA